MFEKICFENLQQTKACISQWFSDSTVYKIWRVICQMLQIFSPTPSLFGTLLMTSF